MSDWDIICNTILNSYDFSCGTVFTSSGSLVYEVDRKQNKGCLSLMRRNFIDKQATINLYEYLSDNLLPQIVSQGSVFGFWGIIERKYIIGTYAQTKTWMQNDSINCQKKYGGKFYS